MKHDIYLKDYLVSRVISTNKEVPGYSKTYYKTNEDLVTPFYHIDVEDKDVLTVLGSSDQLFTLEYLNAKNIEYFDSNRLTIYYYYLRKWTIMYTNRLYPIFNSTWLSNLLKNVNPTTIFEKKALDFYNLHILNKTNLNNLFYNSLDDPNEGKLPYSTSQDLKPYINKNIKGYNISIFNPIYTNKKYDIIVLSNILDWARSKEELYLTASSNLSNLLNNNGIVLCTNLISRDMSKEKSIFKDNFNYESLGKNYVYIKK